MPRTARLKPEGPAKYHVTSRTAGPIDWLPFQDDPEAAIKLRELILFYTGVYLCRLASHEVMGNHFHAVVDFPENRPLPRDQLEAIARRLYGQKAEVKTANWTENQWNRFNDRLFDLSALMRDLKSTFSAWYNRRHNRRGPLWDDRFKSVLLQDDEAVGTMVIYVELNAVRAGLVQFPWEWPHGSAHLRARGDDPRLIPVAELFPPVNGGDAHAYYRTLLLYRGMQPSKENDVVIPEWMVHLELQRGHRPGDLLQPLRALTNGLALGGIDDTSALLNRLVEKGFFNRRRKPRPCLGGQLFTLRRPRSRLNPRQDSPQDGRT